MPHELTLQLDPNTQTGLTVSAKLHSGATLTDTVSLSELPASSARYANADALTLDEGLYDVAYVDSAGSLLGTGQLDWSGSAQNTVGSIESNMGGGADSVTLTITDSDTAMAVADADVWITSDSAGTNTVAGTLQTDSAGEVTFLLDAGVTYFLWMQRDGVNSIHGQAFVAEAD